MYLEAFLYDFNARKHQKRPFIVVWAVAQFDIDRVGRQRFRVGVDRTALYVSMPMRPFLLQRRIRESIHVKVEDRLQIKIGQLALLERESILTRSPFC